MKHSLPPIEQLITSGGDERILSDDRGVNKYGCRPVPHPDCLAYGSSTASTISPGGFAAAKKLYEKLQAAPLTYASELSRIRSEITSLCHLDSLSPDIIFGASGTDLHLFAAQLLCQPDRPSLIIVPDPAETGSGVPAALRGQHFSSRTAQGNTVAKGEPLGDARVETAVVKSREENGDLRPSFAVDAEVEALVERAAAQGRYVLLMLTDVSKTGQIIPSASCVIAMKKRFPQTLDVLVDACQFRLSNDTLSAYLRQDFMVAMTGSKFVGGPTFCGALLVPKSQISRLSRRALPNTLSQYSARADWPEAWSGHRTLPDAANYGLLLRWEAALTEMRAFHALPEKDVHNFIARFADAARKKLTGDPVFEMLPVSPINRGDLARPQSWDAIPTIFPFRLRNAAGKICDRDEMVALHKLMNDANCHLGQPVIAGAIRLCLDMRLIVEALSPQGRGEDAVIAGAMGALDTAARMARTISA